MATILVVEDETALRDDLCAILELEGFSAQGAGNGSIALSLIENDAPDAIISDVIMPEMDGISLLKAVREDPRTAHIPVVLLSALSAPDDVQRGMDSGANAYLKKPISSMELIEMLKKITL